MNQLVLFVFVVLFAFHTHALSDTCSWCVTKNPKVIAEIRDLSARTPADQLKAIRNKGICVKVVGKEIKLAPGTFAWGQVEKPEGKWAEVTVQRNVFSKTLCRGEKQISKGCATIALSAEAKGVFLIQEFLRYRQMESDPAWCPLSKSLWTRSATPQETKILQDKLWDANRALWEQRKSLKISDEDRIVVYGSLVNLARLRKWYDPSAHEYIRNQKIENELAMAVAEVAKRNKRK